MSTNMQQIKILLLKNKKKNLFSTTEQTQKIRNSTNTKIRELGRSYYIVKEIFDKLNIKRDTLFLYGKKLEEEFKNLKAGIHLQSQKRRMKEALICWYTEFFYTEIIQPNSFILSQLILHNDQSLEPVKTKNNYSIIKKSVKSTRKAKIIVDQEKTPIKSINDDNRFIQPYEQENYQNKQSDDDEYLQLQTVNQSNQYVHHDIPRNSNISTGNNNLINIQNDNHLNDNIQSSDQDKESIKINNQSNSEIHNDDQQTSNEQVSEIIPLNQSINTKKFSFKDVKINQEIDLFENGNILNFQSQIYFE